MKKSRNLEGQLSSTVESKGSKNKKILKETYVFRKKKVPNGSGAASKRKIVAARNYGHLPPLWNVKPFQICKKPLTEKYHIIGCIRKMYEETSV